jgi:hypothetical protein
VPALQEEKGAHLQVLWGRNFLFKGASIEGLVKILRLLIIKFIENRTNLAIYSLIRPAVLV